jgi:hypothetical protein
MSIYTETQKALFKALIEEYKIDSKEALSIIKDGCKYNDNQFGAYRIYNESMAEATEAVKDCIEHTLWAFNTLFLGEWGVLADMCTEGAESILAPLQEQCEGGNNAIMALVQWDNNMYALTEEAISHDGYGHFLNSYDGEHVEYSFNGDDYIIVYEG